MAVAASAPAIVQGFVMSVAVPVAGQQYLQGGLTGQLPMALGLFLACHNCCLAALQVCDVMHLTAL
jgi:hypothetical protein